MSLYYQEKIKRSKVPFLAALVGVAIVLLVISGLLESLSGQDSMMLENGILVALFGVLGYMLLHSSKKQIKYSLVHQELLIQEENAGKMRVQDRLFLSQVRSFHPVSLSEKMACISTDASCLIHKAWKLTYEKNGRIRTVIMRPSERLARTIHRELDQLTVQS